MVNEKFGILAKIFLLILILVPITFRVYDLYYLNSSWDINSKVVKRGKVYRDYIKEKKLTGVPNIYYKYNSLTPEEMMTLDVLANTKGYNIEEVLPEVEKYVLSQNNEKNGAKLNEDEKIEVNQCVKQIKEEVKDGLLYVNDVFIDEPYVKNNESMNKTFYVPEGNYLFFGDNRARSEDARRWENPYVPKKNLDGKALFTVYPKDRIGFLK